MCNAIRLGLITLILYAFCVDTTRFKRIAAHSQLSVMQASYTVQVTSRSLSHRGNPQGPLSWIEQENVYISAILDQCLRKI
jgi:hypothetical protein